jgi:hypothetical protein
MFARERAVAAGGTDAEVDAELAKIEAEETE